MFGEEATVTIPKMKRAEVTPPLIEELRKKTPCMITFHCERIKSVRKATKHETMIMLAPYNNI